MDFLAKVLQTTRTEGTVWADLSFTEDWRLRCDAVPMAGLHLIERGACVLLTDEGQRLTLERGDLVLIPRGDGHVLGSDDGAPATAFGELLGAVALSGRPLRWSADPDDAVVGRIVCGGYRYDRSEPHPVLAALPAFVHLRNDEIHGELRQVLDLIFAELVRDEPGAAAIVDRLLEVTLIMGLRTWLARHGPSEPAWIAGLTDPVVSAALDHLGVRTPESVVAWARAIGVSRSSFAARFATVVGEPPGAFLTRWRLDAAARLLRQTDLTVADIAHQVGYLSEFSFSRAFKRERGDSPLRFRRQHAEQQPDDIVGLLERTASTPAP